MKFKIALYLVHRWLGVFMCLPIAMWFATGMVMIYVGYPELTRKEALAGLPAIIPDRIKFPPAMLLATAPPGPSIEHLMLTSVALRPVYLLKLENYPWLGMYADSGDLIVDYSAESAVASAVDFYQSQHPDQSVNGEYLKTLDMDQWTVSSALSTHRPLHLVAIDDAAGTLLYVSSRSGQVVRDTTSRERIWNWLGANLHWVYPVQLRKHPDIWAIVIIVLSLIGLVAIGTGALAGFMELRVRERYDNSGIPRSPYSGILKYHHILGLFGLLFLTTFMFSGLMSMGPWGIFEASSNFSKQVQRYQMSGQPERSEPVYSQVEEIRTLLEQNHSLGVKQIMWHWVGGESHVTLQGSDPRIQIPTARGEDKPVEQKVQNHIARLIPDRQILIEERLERYDSYYYSHHNRHRPLPVLRVKFSDPEATWFHIDLLSGQVIERLTYKDRIERWLFNSLHSLDFAILINNRPVWDLVILSLCSLGLLFSLTSVVLGWRRLNIRR